MSGHTHGPWNICTTTICGIVTHWHITGDKHGSVYPICNHAIEIEPDGSEQLANARLIAAAPELLDALKSIIIKLCDMNECPALIWPSEFEKADHAIAKAEGELT